VSCTVALKVLCDLLSTMRNRRAGEGEDVL
jgi:hypothetical protein